MRYFWVIRWLYFWREMKHTFLKKENKHHSFFFWSLNFWKDTHAQKKEQPWHCSSFISELIYASWLSLWMSILGKKGRDAQKKSFIFLFKLFTHHSHHLSLRSIFIFLKDGPDFFFRVKMIFFFFKKWDVLGVEGIFRVFKNRKVSFNIL